MTLQETKSLCVFTSITSTKHDYVLYEVKPTDDPNDYNHAVLENLHTHDKTFYPLGAEIQINDKDYTVQRFGYLPENYIGGPKEGYYKNGEEEEINEQIQEYNKNYLRQLQEIIAIEKKQKAERRMLPTQEIYEQMPPYDKKRYDSSSPQDQSRLISKYRNGKYLKSI